MIFVLQLPETKRTARTGVCCNLALQAAIQLLSSCLTLQAALQQSVYHQLELQHLLSLLHQFPQTAATLPMWYASFRDLENTCQRSVSAEPHCHLPQVECDLPSSSTPSDAGTACTAQNEKSSRTSAAVSTNNSIQPSLTPTSTTRSPVKRRHCCIHALIAAVEDTPIAKRR